jgi:hypothetical protein
MNPQEFLQADRRWTIWGCQSHEEYLEKYFLPGKFHPSVPDKVKEAYITVERLIAYSFFYYPMEEEVGSKLTRIFEMAIRLRAQSLDIPLETKDKHGRVVPVSLSSLITKLKMHHESDPDWANEWRDFKSLRNVHAHADGPMYGGAMHLSLVAPMINVLNSIFIPKEWFRTARAKITALQERAERFSRELCVLYDRRALLTSAIPAAVSHDERRSLWMCVPVGKNFPLTLDEYKEFSPIILRLEDAVVNEDCITAWDYVNKCNIIISPTDKPANIAQTVKYLGQMNQADKQVSEVHQHIMSYHLYNARERFIYDEYWETEIKPPATI